MSLSAGACGKKTTPPPTEAPTTATTAPTATATAPTTAAPEADAAPTAAEETTVSAKLDDRGFPLDDYRTAQPPLGERAPLVIPPPEIFTLPSGLVVHRVAQTLPTVYISFEFDTGAIDDPPGKLGLASVCHDLFTESTQAKDKVALAEAQADHAVSVFSSTGLETASLVVTALEKELPAALDIFAEIVTSPGLRKEDFDRIIADRKAGLAQARGAPRNIAGRVWDARVWGDEHPYGRIQMEADLDAITIDDCKGWVAKLGPNGARVWIAARLDRAAIEKELGERLAAWKGDAPKKSELPAAAPAKGVIFVVHVPGAVQSQIAVGHAGPRRDAEDYEATWLMTKILAGGFSSRVNMNLREAKGYAYGGGGGFDYRRQGSTMQISSSVETSTTALALRELVTEIKNMKATDATADELSRERDGALQALPARFANASKTLSELQRLAFFGLPFDWFEGHQKRLEAADLATIKTAATTHLQETDLVVLVVGDALAKTKDGSQTVAEALTALGDEKLFGGGGVVWLDADGKPTKAPEPAASKPEPKPE